MAGEKSPYRENVGRTVKAKPNLKSIVNGHAGKLLYVDELDYWAYECCNELSQFFDYRTQAYDALLIHFGLERKESKKKKHNSWPY